MAAGSRRVERRRSEERADVLAVRVEYSTRVPRRQACPSRRERRGLLAKILIEKPPSLAEIGIRAPAALDDIVMRLLFEARESRRRRPPPPRRSSRRERRLARS